MIISKTWLIRKLTFHFKMRQNSLTSKCNFKNSPGVIPGPTSKTRKGKGEAWERKDGREEGKEGEEGTGGSKRHETREGKKEIVRFLRGGICSVASGS